MATKIINSVCHVLQPQLSNPREQSKTRVRRARCQKLLKAFSLRIDDA